MVQPTLRREGFSSIPNVTWDDVGGLSSIRNVFDEYIVQRIKNPEVYEVDYFLLVRINAGFFFELS